MDKEQLLNIKAQWNDTKQRWDTLRTVLLRNGLAIVPENVQDDVAELVDQEVAVVRAVEQERKRCADVLDKFVAELGETPQGPALKRLHVEKIALLKDVKEAIEKGEHGEG